MLTENLDPTNGSDLKHELRHSKLKGQGQRESKLMEPQPKLSAILKGQTCYTLVNVGISVACFLLLVCCLAITSGLLQVVSYQSKALNLTTLQVLARNHSWLGLSAWIIVDGFLAVLLIASFYIPFVVFPSRRSGKYR
jgi:hypothetical protein